MGPLRLHEIPPLPNKPMNLAGAFSAALRFSVPCKGRLIAAAASLRFGHRNPCSSSACRLLAGSLGRVGSCAQPGGLHDGFAFRPSAFG